MNLPEVTLPTPAPSRFKKFGDYMICETCGLEAHYCPGHEAPSVSAAQDGAAARSLDIRIRDAKGAAMRISANDPWVTFCGYCGRPLTVCCTDPHGCGSTPAADECTEGK